MKSANGITDTRQKTAAGFTIPDPLSVPWKTVPARVTGPDIPVTIEIKKEYSAGQSRPSTKKEIYAAMVIYGLLSYNGMTLKIPNKQLMIEFENALEDSDFGYAASLS